MFDETLKIIKLISEIYGLASSRKIWDLNYAYSDCVYASPAFFKYVI